MQRFQSLLIDDSFTKDLFLCRDKMESYEVYVNEQLKLVSYKCKPNVKQFSNFQDQQKD